MSTTALTPEEIKRVKGLGCLRDKRYEDIFNVRVITRNGKLTSAEHRAVAEAADRFGSGAVTMTTRLTLEIQGVPYDKLEALFAFLKENGLETGGTGARVRPIVSCKGTTCQFGLIDTFDLSEKIHRRFYVGGRWGKLVANGRPLSKIFTSEEEVLDAVEKAICLFRDEGIAGERFADTITRLGFEYVEAKLLG